MEQIGRLQLKVHDQVILLYVRLHHFFASWSWHYRHTVIESKLLCIQLEEVELDGVVSCAVWKLCILSTLSKVYSVVYRGMCKNLSRLALPNVDSNKSDGLHTYFPAQIPQFRVWTLTWVKNKNLLTPWDLTALPDWVSSWWLTTAYVKAKSIFPPQPAACLSTVTLQSKSR